ncbi:glutaminase A [Peptoniphilus catoniae]|uniref:glutaminase A n=1 Tax=Peptoniphilus catoniae TaxID=1660341 RepID=UPI0010FEB7D2|nr:glutaminase A [Peptoniphilus catoniae]
MDINKILKEAYEYAKPYTKEGKLVDYLPELAKADINNLGAVVIDGDANLYKIGAYNEKFSIMSIVKVVLYLIVLENYKADEIKNYLLMKNTYNPYNSLLDLENGEGKKPVNPFVNAGAIVTSYLINKKFADKSIDVILEKTRQIMNDDSIDYSREIVDTSMDKADTNFALAYTLKKNKIISQDTDVYNLLKLYCMACAIIIDAEDLAVFSSVLARDGKNLKGDQVIERDHARILRTLMATCGTYDYSMEFALEIGLAAKSGVGGGILAANRQIGIGIYSPGLDIRGNSLASIEFLKYFSKKLDLSIY